MLAARPAARAHAPAPIAPSPLVADAEMILRTVDGGPPLAYRVENAAATLELTARPGRVAAFADHARVGDDAGELTVRCDQIASAVAVDRGGQVAIELADSTGSPALDLAPVGPGDPLRALAFGFATRSAPPVATALPPPITRPDSDLDRAAIRAAWATLEEPAEIAALCRRHRTGRAQIYRLLGPEHAVSLAAGDVARALAAAFDRGIPMVITVANRAAWLTCRGRLGAVDRLTAAISAARLQIDPSTVAELHAVRTPTRFGIRPTVELFDRRGNGVLSLAGDARDPAGYLRWRALHEELSDRPPERPKMTVDPHT